MLFELGGYSVREMFIKEADGSYTFVGYGVFNSDGVLLTTFPDFEAACDHLQELVNSASPSFGT